MTGICIDKKCYPLNIPKNKIAKDFYNYFDNLTKKQQHEYLEKIKDPNYSDAYTPYIRDIRDDCHNS